MSLWTDREASWLSIHKITIIPPGSIMVPRLGRLSGPLLSALLQQVDPPGVICRPRGWRIPMVAFVRPERSTEVSGRRLLGNGDVKTFEPSLHASEGFVE